MDSKKPRRNFVLFVALLIVLGETLLAPSPARAAAPSERPLTLEFLGEADGLLAGSEQTLVFNVATMVPPTETASADSAAETPASGTTGEDAAQLQAQTGNLFLDVIEGNVPIGDLQRTDAWSLLSLILTLIVAPLALVLALSTMLISPPDNDLAECCAADEHPGLSARGVTQAGSAGLSGTADNGYSSDTASGITSSGTGRSSAKDSDASALPVDSSDVVGRPANHDNSDPGVPRICSSRFSMLFRILTIISGLATLAVWLMLDDISLPVVLVNKWTPVVLIIFAACIVFFEVFTLQKPPDNENSGDQSQ